MHAYADMVHGVLSSYVTLSWSDQHLQNALSCKEINHYLYCSFSCPNSANIGINYVFYTVLFNH